MEDDVVPPLVGVQPIPKPDPPAKKQAPLANFFGLPRPIAFSRMPGSSTKIIAPTDGLAFDPGAGERSRAEAVARSRLDAVIAGEIGKGWALVDVPKVRGVGRESDVDKARRGIVEQAGRKFKAAVHAAALDSSIDAARTAATTNLSLSSFITSIAIELQPRRVFAGIVPRGAPGAFSCGSRRSLCSGRWGGRCGCRRSKRWRWRSSCRCGRRGRREDEL